MDQQSDKPSQEEEEESQNRANPLFQINLLPPLVQKMKENPSLNHLRILGKMDVAQEEDDEEEVKMPT